MGKEKNRSSKEDFLTLKYSYKITVSSFDQDINSHDIKHIIKKPLEQYFLKYFEKYISKEYGLWLDPIHHYILLQAKSIFEDSDIDFNFCNYRLKEGSLEIHFDIIIFLQSIGHYLAAVQIINSLAQKIRIDLKSILQFDFDVKVKRPKETINSINSEENENVKVSESNINDTEYHNNLKLLESNTNNSLESLKRKVNSSILITISIIVILFLYILQIKGSTKEIDSSEPKIRQIILEEIEKYETKKKLDYLFFKEQSNNDTKNDSI